MRIYSCVGMSAVVCLSVAIGAGPVSAEKKEEKPAKCAEFHINDDQSTSMGTGTPATSGCQVRTAANGVKLPDPKCTPGAFNNTITAQILRNKDFTTKCLRDDVTTEEQKTKTYEFYGIQHPQHNEGETQTCELDHLVSLELGGADTLDNIWPQCGGPPGATLDERFFKQKDKVENWLAEMVRAGKMDLDAARKGIATDWTQFLDKAKEACKAEKCKVE